MRPFEQSPSKPSIPSYLVSVGVAVALILSILVAIQGGLLPHPSALPLPPEAPPLSNIVAGMSAQVLAIAADSLGVLLPLWLGAAGWGYPLRCLLFPRSHGAPLIQLIAGMSLMLTLCWLAAWAGLLNQFSAWTLCGLGVAALTVQCLQPANRRVLTSTQLRFSWMLILPVPALGLLIVACACPPGTLWRVEAFAYDVLSYHLQMPREWLNLGAMVPLPHNVYSYFPNLVEVGFMQIGIMRGSMYGAIYATQFFHGSLAVLGALGAGCLAARHSRAAGGFVTAAVLLATPWTIIVSSLSYNEMFAVATGAAALLLIFDPQFNGRAALMTGMLTAAAILAKLTAGPMIALPIGILILLRLNQINVGSTHRRSQAVKLTAMAVLGGMIVLSPYLIRNTVWTGNPLFPFATEIAGRAHWSQEQVETWHSGHAPNGPFNQRLARLGTQWLFNTGYGGIFGREQPSDPHEVARFPHEGGPSVFWTAALLSAIGLCFQKMTRRSSAAMSLMIAIQVGFWTMATMQPSRHLYFTILPGSILIGTGIGSLAKHSASTVRRCVPVAAVVLVGALTVLSFTVFYSQIRRPLRPWQVVGAMPTANELAVLQPGETAFGDHPINYLSPTNRTCMVADAAVFYTRRPVTYATAWDTGPLGPIMQRTGGDAATVTTQLQNAGFTHVWIHWSELDRIHETIGRHDNLDADILRRITDEGSWRVIQDLAPSAGLYELP